MTTRTIISNRSTEWDNSLLQLIIFLFEWWRPWKWRSSFLTIRFDMPKKSNWQIKIIEPISSSTVSMHFFTRGSVKLSIDKTCILKVLIKALYQIRKTVSSVSKYWSIPTRKSSIIFEKYTTMNDNWFKRSIIDWQDVDRCREINWEYKNCDLEWKLESQ